MNTIHVISEESFQLLRREYPGEPHGALAVGTPIVKVRADSEGEVHPIGTLGVVRGSICAPQTKELAYFVTWSTGIDGFVSGNKIKEAT